MAAALRPEEQWARQMIARATGCRVEQHDDGSDRGMHDLDIRGLHRAAAVEVVADIDQQRHELWKVIDDQPWTIAPELGSWFVTLEQQARVKTLRSELPALITFLVSHARNRLDVPGWPIEDAGVLLEPEAQSLRDARSLGIRISGVTSSRPASLERSGSHLRLRGVSSTERVLPSRLG